MDSYVDSVIGFATLMKMMKLTNVLKMVIFAMIHEPGMMEQIRTIARR